MKRLLKTIGAILAILLAFLLYAVASDLYYFGAKRPDGISTASDYFRRFGEPSLIRMVERDGQSYYEFNGRVDPPWWCLAFPSGAPAYVFDERGQFVDWFCDPGDSPSYRQRWPLKGTDNVEVDAIRRKFRL